MRKIFKKIKKKKKKHFGNLGVNSMTDNNKFWDTVKLFFSIKVKAKITIELVEITKSLMIKLKLQNYLTNNLQ